MSVNTVVKNKNKSSESTKKKPQQKIRIRLKSFDHRTLDTATVKIVSTAEKSGAKVVGPIPLPIKKESLVCIKVSSC